MAAEEKDSCPICYEPLDDSIELDCKHRYHAQCLSDLFSAGVTKCALCRDDITNIEHLKKKLLEKQRTPEDRQKEEDKEQERKEIEIANYDVSKDIKFPSGLSDKYNQQYITAMKSKYQQTLNLYIQVFDIVSRHPSVQSKLSKKIRDMRETEMLEDVYVTQMAYARLKQHKTELYQKVSELENTIYVRKENPVPLKEEFMRANLQFDYVVAAYKTAWIGATRSRMCQKRRLTPTDIAIFDKFFEGVDDLQQFVRDNTDDTDLTKLIFEGICNTEKRRECTQMARGAIQGTYYAAVEEFETYRRETEFEEGAFASSPSAALEARPQEAESEAGALGSSPSPPSPSPSTPRHHTPFRHRPNFELNPATDAAPSPAAVTTPGATSPATPNSYRQYHSPLGDIAGMGSIFAENVLTEPNDLTEPDVLPSGGKRKKTRKKTRKKRKINYTKRTWLSHKYRQ